MQEETKFRSRHPKIMGFFTQEEAPGSFCSRNNNLKNAKTSTIHPFDNPITLHNQISLSGSNPTLEKNENAKPLDITDNPISNSLESQHYRDASGPQSIKLTDYSNSKPNNTVDNIPSK